MSALPAIPAGLPPAPEPHRGAGEFIRAAYRLGPLIHSDWYSGLTAMCFPTFDKHAEQSRLLRLAGYEFRPRFGWTKRIDPMDARTELAWARRLYVALHPGWRLEPSLLAGTATAAVDSIHGDQP